MHTNGEAKLFAWRVKSPTETRPSVSCLNLASSADPQKGSNASNDKELPEPEG